VNALADENDRLRAAADETARLRRSVAETARDVRAELHRGAAAHAAAQGLGALLGADRAWFRPVEEGSTSTGLAPVTAAWAAGGAVATVDREPETPRGLDLAAARRWWHQQDVLVLDSPAGTVLHAPVGGADDVLGVLTLLCDPGRHLSAAERSAVQSVTDDLGRALEQARLFEQQLELVDRLQELDRQKTDFLSTVSHELRTPLTSIGAYAELIRDGDAGPVSPELDRMLEVVERNTVRLRTLIEDLLTLARIESGTFSGGSTDTPLEPLVRAATATVAPLAERGGVELSAGPVPPEAVVRGDGLQLERVLLNLLSNAVKFTPAGGRVALDVAVGDRHVVLTCADTGIGIPAAEQQHLFDRFFRASNATEQAIPGTGLGLVVVRGIVERHGGSVDLASQHGRGTTATVRLPRRGTGTPGEPTAFSPSVRPLAHWPVGSGSRAPVRGRHDPATKDDEGAPP
jgi:signal transduction histidine kinase